MSIGAFGSPLVSQLPRHLTEPTLVNVVIERIRAGITLEEAKEYYRFLREVQADEARVAAARDFVAMQAELPAIPKLGSAHNYKYAKWEDINEKIKPVLTKHGFALNFNISEESETHVGMTAILTHRGGHVQQTTKRLPLDKSGSKNITQAFGSTQSYGQRYAATALLNLVSHGEDTDAGGSGQWDDPISVDQQTELKDLLKNIGRSEQAYCAYKKIETLSDIRMGQFQACKRELEGWGK